MSGYKSNNLDFDNQFDPDVVGDGPTAPQYKVNGVALKYANIKYGTKGPNCGYAENGVDLSNKWAAKGTASYALPCDGMSANAGEVLTNGQTGYVQALFILNTDGTYVFKTIKHVDGLLDKITIISQGTWNTLGGAASGYQVRYTFSNIQHPDGTTVGTSHPNDAPSFTTITTTLEAYLQVSGGFQGGS